MDVRLEIFRELLATMRPGHLLDLATGHGKFALLARDLGWEVTAVDARTDRMPGEPGIRWVRADVREFDIGEDYDCIAVLGLLYHLELPDQLDLLRRCAGTPTILDTHVALRAEVTVDGYQGRLFDEDLREATAAVGNPTSFWPTAGSLVRMLHECGHTSVYRRTPAYLPDRTFWLCLSGLTGPSPRVEEVSPGSVIDGVVEGPGPEGATGGEPDGRALAQARAEAEHYRRAYRRLRSHPAVRTLRVLRWLARLAGRAAGWLARRGGSRLARRLGARRAARGSGPPPGR